MSISKYFKREEFACECGCGFDTVDVSTLKVLELVREYFGVPVVINSGCRCAAHNKYIGGAKKSQHVFGRAADIVVKGVSPSAVADYIETIMLGGGIGRYNTFTHIDTRTKPARWGV